MSNKATTENDPTPVVTTEEMKKVEEPAVVETDNAPFEEEKFDPATKSIYDYDDIISYDPKTSWFLVENRPMWFSAVLVFFSVVFGFYQGYAYHRIGLGSPKLITYQFTFKAWMVMRFFFSGMGATTFFQGLFDLLVPSLFDKSREARRSHVGFIRSLVGGVIIGMGLAFGGFGASLVMTQVGAGTGGSEWAVLGLVIGAIVGSFMAKFIPGLPMREPVACALPAPKKKEITNKSGDAQQDDADAPFPATVDDWLEIRYWKLAIPTGIFLFVCAIILEYAIPYTDTGDDMDELKLNVMWPAIAGGAITGLNNLLYTLVTNSNVSGGRVWFWPISVLSWGYFAPDDFPNSFKHLVQVAWFVCGMALGGFTSIKTAINSDEELYGHPKAVLMNEAPGLDSIWRSMVGGILTTFGMYLAYDCNCAKSIAMSFSFENLLMTCGLFGSAIVTGWCIWAGQQ